MSNTATAKNVTQVLRILADWLDKEPAAARRIAAKSLNEMLDSLMEDDFFGTEGQCDPRGDRRL